LIIAFTAEMIEGGGGLGAALMYAQRFFQTPTVFVYIIVMLAAGFVFDLLMRRLRSMLIPWTTRRATFSREFNNRKSKEYAMRLVSFVDGSHERLGFLSGDAVL